MRLPKLREDASKRSWPLLQPQRQTSGAGDLQAGRGAHCFDSLGVEVFEPWLGVFDEQGKCCGLPRGTLNQLNLLAFGDLEDGPHHPGFG